jgi:hypothetical protein
MKHSQEVIEKVITLNSDGLSSRSIASLLGIGKSTVNDIINRLVDDEEVTVEDKKEGARILFFDLESTPSIVATFGRWKQNIGTESVLREGGFLLSACWKYLGDKSVTRIVLTPEEAIRGDDCRIVCALYDAFEEADVVVAHNAVRFDVPLFKTRLISHSMPPPKTVKVLDTLQIAKGLRFNSNKLDSLGNYLNVGRKAETTGISLWIRCMQGDEQALENMVTYNEQDVVLLERVYMKLRAFDTRPPNAGHYHEDDLHRCPVCGSAEIHPTGNSVFTPVSEFMEVICNDCGHRSRTRNVINCKEKRANLLVTAR